MIPETDEHGIWNADPHTSRALIVAGCIAVAAVMFVVGAALSLT